MRENKEMVDYDEAVEPEGKTRKRPGKFHSPVRDDSPKYSSRGRRVGRASLRLVEEEGGDWEGVREVQLHQKLQNFLENRDSWARLQARGAAHVELQEFLKSLHSRGSDACKEYRKMVIAHQLSAQELAQENRPVLELLLLVLLDELHMGDKEKLWRTPKPQLVAAIQERASMPLTQTAKEGTPNGRGLTSCSTPGTQRLQNGRSKQHVQLSTGVATGSGKKRGKRENGLVHTSPGSRTTENGEVGNGHSCAIDIQAKGQLWNFLSEPERWPHLKWRSQSHNAYKEVLRNVRETDPECLQELRNVLRANFTFRMEQIQAQNIQVLQVLAYVVSDRLGITHLTREQLVRLCAEEGPWLDSEPNQKLRSVNLPPSMLTPFSVVRPSRQRKKKVSEQPAFTVTSPDEENGDTSIGGDSWEMSGAKQSAERALQGSLSREEQIPVLYKYLGDIEQWKTLGTRHAGHRQMMKAMQDMRETEPEVFLSLRRSVMQNPDVNADSLHEAKTPALRVLAYVLSNGADVEKADRAKLLRICFENGPWTNRPLPALLVTDSPLLALPPPPVPSHLMTQRGGGSQEEKNVDHSEKGVGTAGNAAGDKRSASESTEFPEESEEKEGSEIGKGQGTGKRQRKETVTDEDAVAVEDQAQTDDANSKEDGQGRSERLPSGSAEDEGDYDDEDISLDREVGREEERQSSGHEEHGESGGQSNDGRERDVREVGGADEGEDSDRCGEEEEMEASALAVLNGGGEDMQSHKGGGDQWEGDETDAVKDIQSLGHIVVSRMEEVIARKRKEEEEARYALSIAKEEVATLKEKLRQAQAKVSQLQSKLTGSARSNNNLQVKVDTTKGEVEMKVKLCKDALQKHLEINRELQLMPMAVDGKGVARREATLGAVWESLQDYKRLRSELEDLGKA